MKIHSNYLLHQRKTNLINSLIQQEQGIEPLMTCRWVISAPSHGWRCRLQRPDTSLWTRI
jgi:hypothetical protein